MKYKYNAPFPVMYLLDKFKRDIKKMNNLKKNYDWAIIYIEPFI